MRRTASGRPYWATEHYASPEFGGLKQRRPRPRGGAGEVKTRMSVVTAPPGFVAVVRSGSCSKTAQAVSESASVGAKTVFHLRRTHGTGLCALAHANWRADPAGGVSRTSERVTREGLSVARRPRRP